MKKRYVALIVAIVILVLVIFLIPTVNVWSVQAIVKAMDSKAESSLVANRIDFGGVPQGTTVTKVLSLDNGGSVPNYVRVFIFGSVSNMVKIEPRSFTISGGERRDVRFQLAVPDSAPIEKKFTGIAVILHLPKGLW